MFDLWETLSLEEKKKVADQWAEDFVNYLGAIFFPLAWPAWGDVSHPSMPRLGVWYEIRFFFLYFRFHWWLDNYSFAGLFFAYGPKAGDVRGEEPHFTSFIALTVMLINVRAVLGVVTPSFKKTNLLMSKIIKDKQGEKNGQTENT